MSCFHGGSTETVHSDTSLAKEEVIQLIVEVPLNLATEELGFQHPGRKNRYKLPPRVANDSASSEKKPCRVANELGRCGKRL